MSLKTRNQYQGKEFKKLLRYQTPGVKFYKLLYENKIHHGYSYRFGLNVDPLPFNPSGECQPGGLYFFDTAQLFYYKKHIYEPYYLVEVDIPEKALVYVEEGKYKADKLILKREVKFEENKILRMSIRAIGKNEINAFKAIRYCCIHGYRKLMRRIIRKLAFLPNHEPNELLLRLVRRYQYYLIRTTAKYGKLECLKALFSSMPKEEIVKANSIENFYSVRESLEAGHYKVVKCLLFYLSNEDIVRALEWSDWYIFRRAASLGSFRIVELLCSFLDKEELKRALECRKYEALRWSLKSLSASKFGFHETVFLLLGYMSKEQIEENRSLILEHLSREDSRKILGPQTKPTRCARKNNNIMTNKNKPS